MAPDPLFRASRAGHATQVGLSGLRKCTDEGVQIQERDPGPLGLYGSVMWQSGKALAKFFAWRELEPAKRGTIVGKTALELGAGTGILGLTLARLGAKSVTLTDCEANVVDLLRSNIALNSLEASTMACHLCFGDASTYHALSTFDLIVAADVVYGVGGPAQGSLLAHALHGHVSVDSCTEVFLAYEHREHTPTAFFSEMLADGFEIERLEDGDGKAVGHTAGDPAVYDGSRFVALPDDWEPLLCGEAHTVQIFRLRRPNSLQ